MANLRSLVAAAALLSLTGCAGPPWTISRSPDEITLRWWSDQVSEAQAQDVAGSYCTQMGKAVELNSLEQHGSASVGRYRCV
jgi:hypothetical protein